MTTKQFSKQFTDEQRAEYRKAQRDEAQARLAQAVETVQTSEGFAKWLEMRARFHTYSLNNTFLILAQCPEATRVAGASTWRKLGRGVIKGETSIRVFAPMQWQVACEQGDDGARYNAKRKRWERTVQTFKLVPVFDVAQTHGDELPAPPASVELTGDSHAHLEAPLVTLATELGFSVSTEDLEEGTGGYCDKDGKRIVIAASQSPNARVRVLVHEIAHALGIGYDGYGRQTAEVLVDSATYIVLAGQGFDVSASTVGYVAGWAGKTNAGELMRQFAEDIDTVARRIEAAL